LVLLNMLLVNMALRIIESPLTPPTRKRRQKQLQRWLTRIRTKQAQGLGDSTPRWFLHQNG